MSFCDSLQGEEATIIQAPKIEQEDEHKERKSRVTSQVLESAIRGSDANVLVQAISWARKSCLPNEQIERALSRQRELETHQVQSAGQSDRKHVPVHGEVDEVSERYSCSNVVGGGAGRAKRRRTGKDKLESREKIEAKEALSLVTAGTDLETLSSTIAWAVSVEVEDSILESARRRLAVLKVLLNLRHAMSSSGIDGLIVAIEEAESACLDADIIDAAKVKMRVLELQALTEKEQNARKQAAERSLEDLLLDNAVDIAGIEVALERAVYAGVSGAILVRARRSVLSLKEAQRKKCISEAREQLAIACRCLDAGEQQETKAASDIQKAIDCALRLEDELLRNEALDAQARVDALNEARVLKTKDEASRDLSSAVEWGGVEAIETGLHRACNAGVQRDLVENARRKLAVMRNAADVRLLSTARTALEAAINGSSAEHLRSAVILSMRAGVGMAELWRAQKRMAVLEESSQCGLLRDAATIAIHDAVDVRSEAKLRLALLRGEELGVDEEVMRIAKMQLAQML